MTYSPTYNYPWFRGLGLRVRGSWVVISGVRSPVVWVLTIDTLLITPLITTHEPLTLSPKPLNHG